MVDYFARLYGEWPADWRETLTEVATKLCNEIWNDDPNLSDLDKTIIHIIGNSTQLTSKSFLSLLS